MSCKLTSLASGSDFVWSFRMSKRSCELGSDISISLSNRPGRLRAGSIAFGRLVVAMTGTAPTWASPAPSMSVSSCATMRVSCALPSCLVGQMASISSINMTLALPFEASFRAFSNTLRSRFSLSPAYAPKTSPLLTENTRTPASSATALTASVFPVPGGP